MSASEKTSNPQDVPTLSGQYGEAYSPDIGNDGFPRPDPPRQKWYQWFAPTDTPEERRLIMKLDGLILVFVFLAYWAKVLDQSTTSTAYVSGMKEDLNLFGNQLNYLNTIYM